MVHENPNDLIDDNNDDQIPINPNVVAVVTDGQTTINITRNDMNELREMMELIMPPVPIVVSPTMSWAEKIEMMWRNGTECDIQEFYDGFVKLINDGMRLFDPVAMSKTNDLIGSCVDRCCNKRNVRTKFHEAIYYLLRTNLEPIDRDEYGKKIDGPPVIRTITINGENVTVEKAFVDLFTQCL